MVIPRRGAMKPARPYLALDVESRDWKNADVIGIYDGIEYRSYWRFDYLLRDLERRYNGHDIYAHYGGGFDFWFLLPYIKENYSKVEITRARSRIGTIYIKEHDIRLIDSYNIMPYSLKEIVQNYNLGNYKDITGDWQSTGDLELRQRNEADCRLLYHAIAKWREFSRVARFKPDTVSMGSAAVDSWLRHLRQPMYCQWSRRDLAQNAFFGGRLQVFQGNAKDALWYDLNSAYGWALTQPVPIGDGIPLGKKRFDRGILQRKDIIAFVHCKVTIPDFLPVGPLPVRIIDKDQTGGYRVEYPTGVTVHGVWCSTELEQALSFGCKIEEIGDAHYYSAVPVLRKWVNKLYQLRGQWPLFAKRLVNSLYGKLGQGLESHKLYLNPSNKQIKDKELAPYLQPQFSLWIESTITKVPTKLLPIAAAVASRVRARLTNLLVALVAWGNELVYCDTDGIVYVGDPLPDAYGIGLGLGDWKLVGHVKRWKCLQSRWYAADIAAIGDTEVKVKLASSGIERMKESDFRALVQGLGVDRKRWIGSHNQLKAVMEEGKGFPIYEKLHIEYTVEEIEKLMFSNREKTWENIERRLYYTSVPR